MEYELEILGESPRTSKNTRVVAQCVCGDIRTYQRCALRSGNTASCGCKRRACNLLHGLAGTPIYHAWEKMKHRCCNPSNPAWNRYGGRGITVCDRWQKFENFYEDMGDKPEGKELDRIDNNWGYFPENCRWVTHKENTNNRQNCIKIELGYIQLTLIEFAELAGISYDAIRYRWHKYRNTWDCLFPPTN